MKQIISTLLFSLITIFSNAQNQKSEFHIQGNYIGDSAKFVVLSYTNSDSKSIHDTCAIIKNRFDFLGNINEPTVADLIEKAASSSVDDPNFTEIFIEPKAMKINLEENHFKSAKVYGSETQAQYDSLKKIELPVKEKMAPFDAQAEKLADSIRYFLKRKDTISAYKIVEKRYKIIHTNMEPYLDEQNNIEREFIYTNPNSYLSAYLLNHLFSYHHLANDSVWYYYNKFASYVQNSYWGKQTKHWLGDIVPINSTIPNVIGVNPKDKNVSLDSLLNNDYTLIIFWASWCIPCRQLTPTYTKIYNQYHSKGLKFIAITEDEDKKRWLAAIVNDNTLNWVHIFSDNAKNNLPNTYGLDGIPAEFLLKGNKVIAKYAGADNEQSGVEDLQNKLQEIYK